MDIEPVDSTWPERCDVAIVGAGFAGTSAAITLSRLGLSVVLIDLNSTPRANFRVEKLAAEQLHLLDNLGLLEVFKSLATIATQAVNIRGRTVIDRSPVEDHGLLYVDTLKMLRGALPPAVRVVTGRVSALQTSADRQTVRLDDGRETSARLAVLATGHARGLRETLGIERRSVHPMPTISIAFTLRAGPKGFVFPSMAAYGERTGDGVDYTSIFPVGAGMRVNVFMFASVQDRRVAAFKRDPMAALLSLQPGLGRWLEGSEVIKSAEFFVLDLSICEHVVQPGVVLIGDAFRTACPGVGDGLNCVFRDVLQLTRHVQDWMKTPGMDAQKITRFYDDPLKRAQDESAHCRAIQRRQAMLSSSAVNRLRRKLHFSRRWLRNRVMNLTGRAPGGAGVPGR